MPDQGVPSAITIGISLRSGRPQLRSMGMYTDSSRQTYLSACYRCSTMILNGRGRINICSIAKAMNHLAGPRISIVLHLTGESPSGRLLLHHGGSWTVPDNGLHPGCVELSCRRTSPGALADSRFGTVRRTACWAVQVAPWPPGSRLALSVPSPMFRWT